MTLLTLGNIEFQGFEIPGQIRFGGEQSLAIHKLIGGARVIDAVGRDDSAVTWSGILSGSGAADRARVLDLMRVSGSVQSLTWNAFFYSVVVQSLELEFSSPWWIPYRIRCAVLQDLAQGDPDYLPSIAEEIQSDFSSLEALLDPGTASMVAGAAATALSAAGSASTLIQLGSVQAILEGMSVAAESGLDSTDLTEILSSTGTLAQLGYAAGFLNRAVANLSAGAD